MSLIIALMLIQPRAITCAQPLALTSTQCTGTTQKGNRCKNKVASGTRCHLHRESTAKKPEPTSTNTSSVQCSGTTKKGQRCKNRVKNGTRCHLHD